MSFPSTSPAFVAGNIGDSLINAVHPDIIETHILTKLDGPTLTAAGCASSQIFALCTREKLWKDICNSTWPSINNPIVEEAISTFPAGYQSFFSDSFPTLHHLHNHRRRKLIFNQHHKSPTSGLISAVDIRYQDNLVFSDVKLTETLRDAFLYSSLRIDLLNQKKTVETPVKYEGEDADKFLAHLEEKMTLSWIVINPTRNRAANISSPRPVLVQRHWLMGEIQLQYVTVMAADRRGQPSEFVQYRILVTCEGKEGRMMHVREVSLQVLDLDGKCLSGRESLVILQEAIKNGKEKERESWEGDRKVQGVLRN